MRFTEAEALARQGELVGRDAYGEEFMVIRDGKTLRGHFIGESGFAEMRAYAPTDADRRAEDWRLFVRILPDAWEGCDTNLEAPLVR